MTDQQPAPLQPPAAAATLTLNAPPPPQPVAATAAPRMAPAVEAAALPGLDAKVDGYLESLMAAAPRSPEFAAKATDVRTMGDVDIRQAAETSNRLLSTRSRPCRRVAWPRGRGSARRCSSCAAPSRTSTRGGDRRQEVPRHGPVRRQGHLLLPGVPSRRRATSTASSSALRRPGRAGKDNAALDPGRSSTLG